MRYECAHLDGYGGPLCGAVLFDECDDDFVFLNGAATTSAVHNLRSVIPVIK
jgi:hypothetical protein